MIIPEELAKDGNIVYKVSVEPLIEPISLDDLKLFARIDGDTEDALLQSLITSARSFAENYLNRSLIEQTLIAKMDFWPCEAVALPRSPLISITSVQTLDEDDTATTYSSDNYYLDLYSEPGKIILKNGVSAPTNTDRTYGGFKITYKAGYGAAASNVPKPIRDGIKQWAMNMYENRAIAEEPPFEVKTMLDLYKVHRV